MAQSMLNQGIREYYTRDFLPVTTEAMEMPPQYISAPPLPTLPPPQPPIREEVALSPILIGQKRKREEENEEEERGSVEKEVEFDVIKHRHAAQSPVREIEERSTEGIRMTLGKKKKATSRTLIGRSLIRFVKEFEDALPPFRATSHSAGLDLSTPIEFTIRPQEIKKINIGLKIQLPRNTYGQIVSRSSKAISGLVCLGGVLDEDYRGPIMVVLHNMSPKTIRICRGESICQLICIKVAYPKPYQVSDLSSTTRGSGGFGSTDSNKLLKLECSE